MDIKEIGEHPDSPDGVDDSLGSESDAEESAGGSETENTDEFFEAQEEEAMPDGDSNADLHALLAFSKSRLEKTPQAPSPPTEANGDTEGGEHVAEQAVTTDDENSEKIIAESPDDRRKALDHGRDAVDEKKIDDADDAADDAAAAAPSEEQVAKDQAYYIELALRKGKEAEAQAKRDEDPAYLLELAEKKVRRLKPRR